ncbi:SH3 domain-containing protein [Massariosphaeria phaeospora]|uniref:SH3 domain-containing protein n=1 Tax=Massariosphaeria phaeospora TaxID=100035 RepID=A0A7C8IDK4_9PLEO|nr:SH3 domain-containing protein [Massariosphaeria phaeospora]
MAESFSNAMINRSLRTVKTELEFLVDANVITSQQYDAMLNQLPASAAASSARALPAAPVQELAQLNMKKQQPEPDKKNGNIGYYTSNNDVANGPPPAYPTPPAAPAGPMMLAYATAMYQYNAQDAGDLALMPNDKIVVHEYMNNEWWKGLNERTGQEGIFPASYVRREEKGLMPTPAPGPPAPSNYGNMPLDVSQGASHNNNNTPQEPGKGGEMGKKFGKKLGNAAIFGAGASIGGKIVNGIF